MTRPRPLLLLAAGLLVAEGAAFYWWLETRPPRPEQEGDGQAQTGAPSGGQRLPHLRALPPPSPPPVPRQAPLAAAPAEAAAPSPNAGAETATEHGPYADNPPGVPPPSPEVLARERALRRHLDDLARNHPGVEVVFADCGDGPCVGRVSTRSPDHMRGFLAAARRSNLKVDGRVRERLTAFNGRQFEVDLAASQPGNPGENP